MIKNIVFDFGGVIADISREQAVKAFIRLGVKDADRILDKYHQTGIFQELEEGSLTDEAYRNELGKLCGRTLSWEEVQQAWLGFITGVDIRKLEYLEMLRSEGYKLYVLSNTNPYVMGWACSERFSSEGKPLTSYFDKLYLSYQVGCTKPEQRIFEYMLSDAGLAPKETLFVDDGQSNINIASQLGMHTFQPENGCDWRKELSLLLAKLK